MNLILLVGLEIKREPHPDKTSKQIRDACVISVGSEASRAKLLDFKQFRIGFMAARSVIANL